MAQPGQTTIQLYSTTTTATSPSPANLVSGELALNLTDKKIFSKDGGGSVVEMSMSPLNPSYTGTLTGGTGVVNLGAGHVYKAADGKVGFGTPSPVARVHIAEAGTAFGASEVNLALTGANGFFNSSLLFASENTNYRYQNKFNVSDGSLTWRGSTDGSTYTDYLTLTSAGNFGLGVTPSTKLDVQGTGTTTVGRFRTGSYSSSTVADFGRVDSAVNAAIAYDGSGFMRFGTTTAHKLTLMTGAVDQVALDASGNLTPGANGTQAFGSTSLRWSQVWCTAGAFNTSDARLKTTPVSFTAKEVAAAKALSKEVALYQWLESVEAKGADKARQHVGLTVQRAEQVLKDHGLDPWRYGFMSYDKWDDVTVDHPATEAIEAADAVLDDDGNVVTPAVEAVPAKDAWTEVTLKEGEAYAFRYDQLNLFISRGLNAEIEAMQSQLDEQNTAMQLLASRLAALEAA